MIYINIYKTIDNKIVKNEIGKRLDKITKDNKVFVKYTLIMAITTKGVFRLDII